MAAKPFIVTITGLSGSVESGGLLYSFVRSTSTPRPLYTDVGLGTPATNPVVADALGLIAVYFNDTLEYSWRAKTADGATTLWEADVVSGVLALTYINPDYSEHPIIEASWVPALGAPLGEGWVEAFADDFAEQTGSVDPLDHGAMGDCVKGSDGVATATDATFTSASLSATSSDVGKVFIAHGAGTGGAPLVTTIASINSSTSIELATPAVTTVASGCVWTKSTDDTAALETAAAAAVTAKLPLDLRGRAYGVSGFDLPKNLHVRSTALQSSATLKTFVDLAPATASRVTLRHLGDGTGSLKLENISIDRNGGSTSTTLYSNQGIRFVSLEAVTLSDVEITGYDAGESCKLDTIAKVHLDDLYVHDCRYVHSSQTDDTIEGVTIDTCDSITGSVTIRSLGRTDLTSASRDRLSRGLTIVGAKRVKLDFNVSRVDQGVDISGVKPTLGMLSGTISYCASNGLKFANAQIGSTSITSITQCGLCGITVGGTDPTDSDWTTWSQTLLISGHTIRNIGTNQIWSAQTDAPAGVLLSRESALSPANQFPKGIDVTGNKIFSDQGSATFTASGSTLTLQENGMPVQTGVRVRLTNSGGALPTGLSAGTDYYLIEIAGTLTCKLASSYINALDGTAITTTDAGTGTHTLTLQQDMKYKVSFTDITEDTNLPNVAFNNPGGGFTVGEYKNSAPPSSVIEEVAQTGQLQGFKNRIINGSFGVSQRTAASNADDTYTPLDRWYVLTQSNAIAVTQLTDPEDGAPNGIRLTQSNASAQRIGLAQIVESANCRDLRSVYAAFSGRVRRSDGGDVRCAILAWTGTADAVTSDVVADWTSASYTAGGFFNSTTLSVVAVGEKTTSAATWTRMDVLVGALPAGTNNLICIAWSEGTMAQNATIDFNRMQLEPGRKATIFELRPRSVELALCQRYYEAGGTNAGPFWSGNATNGETYQSHSAFKVTKRATPTITLTSTANLGFPSSAGTATANIHGVSEARTANATDVARLFQSSYLADAEL